MAHIDKRKTTKGEWRYEVRYRGPDGKERTRTFRTRKLADDHLTTVRSELQRGTWVDPRHSARLFGDVAVGVARRQHRQAAERVGARRERPSGSPQARDRRSSVGSLTPADMRRLVEKWKANHARHARSSACTASCGRSSTTPSSGT